MGRAGLRERDETRELWYALLSGDREAYGDSYRRRDVLAVFTQLLILFLGMLSLVSLITSYLTYRSVGMSGGEAWRPALSSSPSISGQNACTVLKSVFLDEVPTGRRASSSSKEMSGDAIVSLRDISACI